MSSARELMWLRHAFNPHRVSRDVFLAVFKQINNTLERKPNITLAEAADSILRQLERE